MKAVCKTLGTGSGLVQAIWLITLKLKLCKAKPRLKMMW